MSNVRLRTFSTTESREYIGVEGEVTIDTGADTLVVHDGTVVGGHPLLRADKPRGWTKREHFRSDGTWTKIGKSDLKRLIVYAYGGGGGGDTASWSSGGGQGGVGYADIDAANITTNVSVTIGAGGSAGNNGGITYFGSYIVANGGGRGFNNGSYLPYGGKAGNASGSGVIDLGGHSGQTGIGYSATANSNYGTTYAPGGGPGGGGGNTHSATGCLGGGGGSTGTGADGSVIVEEIYGEY
jgi:hypothetical protein